MKRNSYRQKYEEDGQTILQGNPICACPQNGGLSSKDDCSLQKAEELSQIDLSKFPDGTRVVRVSPYLTLDIPDSFFEQNQGSHEDSGLHNLYTKEGYLSEEHRKEQLAFLNGRSPKDNPGVLPISK
ncbi:hypothetical protein [Paraprevotella xylaniphila]|uniref:hypothetical protein n=1 Tax=Paraprevotella xylaniphila TaxID=454155 RepID=UPI0024A8AF52|nr:hypothetical protein [Paraprevotella xylaniphila]